jgi:hypothetical protein
VRVHADVEDQKRKRVENATKISEDAAALFGDKKEGEEKKR